MPNLKSFLLATVRLAVAIVLALGVLVLAIWAFSNYREARRARAEASLANPRAWPPITLEPLGNVHLALSTMWRDGHAYYQFRIDGFPLALATAKTMGTQATFTLTLLDMHGFKIHEQQVSLDSMLRLVDEKGQAKGLEWKGDEDMSVDTYRALVRWEVAWSGFPDEAAENTKSQLPSAQSEALWKNKAKWRQLSRGDSRDSVRELLGEPTKVDQLGSGRAVWYYGYPSGGEVWFDRSGEVQSWTEP